MSFFYSLDVMLDVLLELALNLPIFDHRFFLTLSVIRQRMLTKIQGSLPEFHSQISSCLSELSPGICLDNHQDFSKDSYRNSYNDFFEATRKKFKDVSLDESL